MCILRVNAPERFWCRRWTRPRPRPCLPGNEGVARALLHLTNFEEPFGLSVVEAMACATPVIAMRRGSMPELIEPGVNGFLVDSVEEAVAAIDRVETLDRAQVRETVVQRFSVARMADAYLQRYARVREVKSEGGRQPFANVILQPAHSCIAPRRVMRVPAQAGFHF